MVASPPRDLRVRKSVLFGDDPSMMNEFEDCKAIAFSGYEGHAPCFQILLKDGSLFSYIGTHLLFAPGKPDGVDLGLQHLAYRNCPAGRISVYVLQGLVAEGEVHCFFKGLSLWMSGKYWFTVDWVDENEQLHCICLENGQIAFLPNHKLKFGNTKKHFEKYMKIRQEWKVTDHE